LDLQKYAAELRVGDVLTEHPKGRAARTYRVIAIGPGSARTTMSVTAACVTTGQRREMYFFLVNRVEVRDEPTKSAREYSSG
jgi:hypothetical protein